jgi:hypothetical protein
MELARDGEKTMATVNELLERVIAGQLTVTEAAIAARTQGLDYGIRYYTPANRTEWDAWVEVNREYRARYDEKVPAAPSLPTPASVCRRCGGDGNQTTLAGSGLCDDCVADG